MLKFKKKVSLAFLGEEYLDSYIELESIPMPEFEQLAEEAKSREGKDGDSIAYIREHVEKRFLGGSVSQDGKMVTVTAEDLKSFPVEVYVEAFEQLVGKIPKAE